MFYFIALNLGKDFDDAMKSFYFAFSLGLLLLSGCTSLQENQTATVAPPELPQTTPFDSNAMSRAAYLDAYQDGYRAAARGRTVSTDFIQGPNTFARKLGLRAGAAAYHESEPGKIQEVKPTQP